MSMEVHMALSGIGDLILLRLGKNERKLNILLDTGNTKSSISDLLYDVYKREESIDYVIITHDDGDHINGLYYLMKEIEGYDQNEKPSILYTTMLNNLTEERILVNLGARGETELLSSQSMNNMFTIWHQKASIDFTKIKYLLADPDKNDPEKLNIIQIKWHIDSTGKLNTTVSHGSTIPKVESDEEHAELVILAPTRERLYDYIHKEWASINASQPLSNTANRDKREWDYSIQDLVFNPIIKKTDSSIVNRASIAFLLLYNGTCSLFAGDASPLDICQNAKKYLAQFHSGEASLPVNFIKLPHHGSSYNITPELLKLFPTDVYLISTCGTAKHQNPGKQTLSQIALAHCEDSEVQIYSNNSWWNTLDDFYKSEKDIIQTRLGFCSLTLPEQKAITLKFNQLTKNLLPIKNSDIFISL